ncbi:MAG TPA: CHAD domain-containing protein [Acidimicrobiales bacterium]
MAKEINVVRASVTDDPEIEQRRLSMLERLVSEVDATATLGQLVQLALAEPVREMLQHAPRVRWATNPDDIHHYRVATRRLRSNLLTFESLLDPSDVERLRSELRWLGAVIGVVRDADVLHEHLRERMSDLSSASRPHVEELIARLDCERGEATVTLHEAMDNERFGVLTASLSSCATAPPFVGRNQLALGDPAMVTCAHFARYPWRRLRRFVASLDDDPADHELHRLRILTKRCRYAVEAVSLVEGELASEFAASLAELQGVLGEQHDAVVAELWLAKSSIFQLHAGDVVKELIRMERERRDEARHGWKTAWRAVLRKRLRSWI